MCVCVCVCVCVYCVLNSLTSRHDIIPDRLMCR